MAKEVRMKPKPDSLSNAQRKRLNKVLDNKPPKSANDQELFALLKRSPRMLIVNTALTTELFSKLEDNVDAVVYFDGMTYSIIKDRYQPE